MAAARDGDRDVLRLIITAAIPKLVSFYRGQGIRIHDAEDLAGDACEAVVRTFPRLRDPDRFEPWFWKIARSKLRDHFRRNGRRQPRPDSLDWMMDDPSDLMMIADEHAQVRAAFATLGARDRELLWMRDVVGLAYKDISGRLRLNEGAVRIAVMRARQRLETALEHRSR